MLKSFHYVLAWMDANYRDAYWESVALNQRWYLFIEQCIEDQSSTSTSRIHFCA